MKLVCALRAGHFHRFEEAGQAATADRRAAEKWTSRPLFPIMPAMNSRLIRSIALLLTVAAVRAQTPPNGTLLFQNLQKLSNAFRVDNPAVASTTWLEGPKGLAAGDFDGDGRVDLAAGNHDGTIGVLFRAPAPVAFEPVRHLIAGDPRGLRDVIATDVSGDARPEIIAAHPFEGKLYIFSIGGGPGSRTFRVPQTITTWPGARGVTAGDFNGDGKTDLAVGGAGDGFREFRGDGLGGFTALPPVAAIQPGPFRVWSAKPVFTMHAWRHSGETRDRLTVSFAMSGYVWILAAPTAGAPLEVAQTLPLMANESIYDLTMGFVSAESRVSGEPDLLTAVTWSGEVFIRRHQGAGATIPYPTTPQVRLAVPGAPRALALADVNGDTWPDLLVASREGNTLSLYLNSAGRLTLSSQTPAGSSPRDVVAADFDSNGLPDAAVINRESQDITVHRIAPANGWFYRSPMVQKAPGGALSLTLSDMNGDSRDDMLYLTPATGHANIQRLSGGAWLPPQRWFMGERPQTLSSPDINNDGRRDLLTTSLGGWQTAGGLSYRLQLPDGTFGALATATLPAEFSGGMFAQIPGDFNSDGRLDFIAGYYDCRVAFFEGTSNGLVHRRTEFFTYESRALAASDLDQDGDLDLVGAGAYGDLAVVENDGQWFTGGPYLRTLAADRAVPGAYNLTVSDRNGDGDPDLMVTTSSSVSFWNGGTGLTFTFDRTEPIATTFDTNSRDYDGDGIADIFALCPSNATATFFKGVAGNTDSWWQVPWVPYSVPYAQTLATGDIDADGRPDLAGAGEYVWVAFSGTPAPAQVPSASTLPQPEITGVVINEVLASTAEFIPPGATKPVDCVEIYNGSGAPANLSGWALRFVALPGETQKPDYIFPAATLPAGGFAVVYCNEREGVWQAPFKLPASGCTLRLLTAAAAETDTVTYPAQQEDVSFARLFDGSHHFVFNPFPGIGSTNYDNGSAEPNVSFRGVDATLIQIGRWRFRAVAWDDNGMFTMAIHWRQMDGGPGGVIPLFDDGMHDDGGSLDGVFAGDWANPLPAGTAIEFYLTGMDLLSQQTTVPDGPDFTAAGAPVENYTLALPATPPAWEISEVVSRNHTGLRDENGFTHDWAEFRYLGAAPAAVQGSYLADSLFGFDSAKFYDISRAGTSVTPGTSRAVFLSDSPDSGSNPLHAPFGVNGEGDTIFLIRRLASGATELMNVAKVPALPPDTAWARMGARGPFVKTAPTPFAPNAPAGGALYFTPGAPLFPGGPPGTDALVAFPGAGGVEASSNLSSWLTVLPPQPDNGFENTWREPFQKRRFFRVH